MAEPVYQWGQHSGQPYALIALGTNMAFETLSGAELLQAALTSLSHSGLDLLAQSSFWLSPAWPDPREPAYVNAVAAVAPNGRGAQQTLDALLCVERAFGRERRARWASRTLDLDIIDFCGLVLDGGGLTLPHPRCAERAFVLAPLAEVAPGWVHPTRGETVESLLGRLDGRYGLHKVASIGTERV